MADVKEQLRAAIAHHRAGRFAAARTSYRAVLQALPDQPTVIHLLSLVELHENDIPTALALAEKAIALDRNNADHRLALGRVLHMLGRFDEASRALFQAAVLAGRHDPASWQRGHVLHDAGLAASGPAPASHRVAGADVEGRLVRFGRAAVSLPWNVPVDEQHRVYVSDFSAVIFDRCLHFFDAPAWAAAQAALAGPPAFVGCLSLGYHDTYYHWLIDCLPNLWALRVLPPATTVLASATHAYQGDSIRLMAAAMGLAPPCLDTPVAASGYVRLDDAWLAVPLPFGARLRVLRRLSRPVPPTRRLYISRRDASRRRLVNEAALLDRLLPLGFELVEPSRLSFAEQVETFAGAAEVIGVCGAGMANLAFAGPGTVVVDLFAGIAQRQIELIGRELGHRHARVEGALAPSPDPPANPNLADLSVDVDAVLRARAGLLAGAG